MSIYKAFENLKWDGLRQNHQERWNLLRSRYHLDPEQIQPCTSLDDLARRCVQLCSQYLFTSAWQQQAPDVEPSKGWAAMTETIPADFLENQLTVALCDHLIVTFAHRFYCDNLQPHRSPNAKDRHEFKGCLKVLFKYYALSIPSGKKRGDARRNFRSAKLDSFELYQKGITETIHQYLTLLKECGVDVDQQEGAIVDLIFSDMFAAPNWLFSIVMVTSWTNNPFSAKSRENDSEDDPENGEFIFLRNWNKETNQQDRCLLDNLTGLLADNELCQFLLKWEPESTSISWPPNVSFVPVDSLSLPVLQIRRTDVWNEKHMGFVAVPCNLTWLCSSKQADDSCTHRKGTSVVDKLFCNTSG